MIIRHFTYSDLTGVTELARRAFADELLANGTTPEIFEKQIGRVAFGRMIPFKLLMAISQTDWRIFVAEIRGRIVGTAGYIGRSGKYELANLMVDPDFRRQGIGAALLASRLRELRDKNVRYATATILADNIASARNVIKQGFQLYDRFIVLEVAIPKVYSKESANLGIREIIPSDRPFMQTIETKTASREWLNIHGSLIGGFIYSRHTKLINSLTGRRASSYAFIVDSDPVGFLKTTWLKHQSTAILARPLITEDHALHLPAMIELVSQDFIQHELEALQIAIPAHRHDLMRALENSGWEEKNVWHNYVRWLSGKNLHL